MQCMKQLFQFGVMNLKIKIDFEDFDMFAFMKKHGLTTEDITDIVSKASEKGAKIFAQYVPYDYKNRHNYHAVDYTKVSQIRIYPNAAYSDIGLLSQDWEKHKHVYFFNYDVSSEHYHWLNKARKAVEPVVLAEMRRLVEAKISSKN